MKGPNQKNRFWTRTTRIPKIPYWRMLKSDGYQNAIHSGLCNCAQPSCGAALQSRPARSAALFLSEQLKAVPSQECPLRGHGGSGEPPHMESSYAQLLMSPCINIPASWKRIKNCLRRRASRLLHAVKFHNIRSGAGPCHPLQPSAISFLGAIRSYRMSYRVTSYSFHSAAPSGSSFSSALASRHAG